MNTYRKSCKIGPGGIKCSCCNPMDSQKHKSSKVYMNRYLRRKNKHNIGNSKVLNYKPISYFSLDEEAVAYVETKL